MMKTKLLIVALFIGLTGYVQTTEFVLNKGLTVGCYNANALTDIAKKVTVTLNGQAGVLKITSINCSKEINGVSLGVIKESTNGTGYYDSKEAKGFIIENNQKIIIFNGKDGKYDVTAVGHTDKASAKTLDMAAEQTNYTEAFGRFESIMAAAKERQKAEEMAANTYPVPTGEYTDEYGISGLYYLSKNAEVEVTENNKTVTKYVTAVYFEFLPNENTLKIHYADGKYTSAYIESLCKKPLKEKTLKYIYFLGDNMSKLDFFANSLIYPLEKDVYFIACHSKFRSNTACTDAPFESSKDKSGNPDNSYVIVGKNKERVEELANDLEQVKVLGSKSALEMCETLNNIRAGKTPMPAEGMKDTKLREEAWVAIKAKAVQSNWPQKLEYCYISSTEWITLRNKTTGIITGRAVRCILVMSIEGGKCQWEEFEVMQNYDGVNYGKTVFSGNTANIVPVDCGTAMKYK